MGVTNYAPPLGLDSLCRPPAIPPYRPYVGVVGHAIDRCITLDRLLSHTFSEESRKIKKKKAPAVTALLDERGSKIVQYVHY